MMNDKKSFFRTKGIYIAVAVCLLAVAAIAYTSLTSMLAQNEQGRQKEMTEWVEQEQSSQPTLPQQPSQPSSQSEESVPLPEQSEPSEPAIKPEPLQKPQYTLPLDAPISLDFSGDKLIKNETLNDWRTHNGVDFDSSAGTPVSAVFAGEVIRADKDDLWGCVVELKLDSGYNVVYAGLERLPELEVGARVEAGEQIGTVGSTSVIEGKAGAHLHFEVKSGDKYIDPKTLFTENKATE